MIDVSELIGDPDFSSRVTLIRRHFERDDNGRTRETEERVEVDAVLQPATPEDLTTLATTSGDAIASEVLALWTSVPLTAGGPDRLCDIIEAKGKTFNVSAVEDFMDNGGYCRALATRYARG